MALLGRVNSLKQAGLSEVQIANALKEEGISATEINDALSQSKIKADVSGNEMQSSEFEGMQPSVMQQEQTQQFVGPTNQTPTTAVQGQYTPASAYEQQNYPPQTYVAQQPTYAPQEQSQAYAQESAYAPQDQYGQQYAPQYVDQTQTAYDQSGQAYYSQGLDLETVRDISKQIIEESLKKTHEDIGSLNKMKSEIKFEVQDIQNRLIKIESTMNTIQSAIIRKMGEYGEAISGISNEIRATQESFSKVINPLLDKKRNISSPQKSQETEAGTEQESSQKQSSRGEKSASFEDYFR